MTEEIVKENIERRSNVKFLWILAIIVLVCIVIGAVIYKANNSDTSLIKVLVWAFILSLIPISGAGGFQIYRLYSNKDNEIKKSDKLPPAISKELAKTYAIEELKNTHFDYIDSPDIDSSGQCGKSGQSSIYTLAGKGLYKNGDNQVNYYSISINQNYPERRSVILISGPKDVRITKQRNQLSVDPEDEPTIERVTESSALTGVTRVTEKKEKTKEKKEEQKKKEESL